MLCGTCTNNLRNKRTLISTNTIIKKMRRIENPQNNTVFLFFVTNFKECWVLLF